MISKNHNICIRKATSLDEEIIKNIWRESFHLPEDYLEHLFKSLYNVANAFILEDNGEAASSLFLFNITLTDKSKNTQYNGYYLYGVCTFKKYRNRSYGTKLINEIITTSERENKDFIITVPASAPLFNYYKKFGFNIDVPRGTINFQPSDIEKIKGDKQKLSFIKKSIRENNNVVYELGDKLISYMITSKEIYNKNLYKEHKHFEIGRAHV